MSRLPTTSGLQKPSASRIQLQRASQSSTAEPKKKNEVTKPSTPSRISRPAVRRETKQTRSESTSSKSSTTSNQRPTQRIKEPPTLKPPSSRSSGLPEKRSVMSAPAGQARSKLGLRKPTVKPSAPSPPTRTTSKLSEEPPPPALPKKETKKPVSKLRPARTPGQTSGLTKVRPVSNIGSRTLESPSSRIRPPAFNANSPTVSKSEKTKVTKLAYVSKSRYSAPSASALPAPTGVKKQSKPQPPLPVEPKESTKNVVQIIQSATQTAPPPIPVKTKSATTSHDEKLLTKPPTPPQRTSSSSIEPPKPEEEKSPSSAKSLPETPNTVEKIEVPSIPPPSRTPPTKPTSPPTTPKRTESPDKKSKFSTKIGSKLSKISPKFPRKKIEVAKSFITSKTSNDEKQQAATTAKPDSTTNDSPSKMSKIEKLFSPKLKPKKTAAVRAISPPVVDTPNPQFLEQSIIDEEITDEEDTNISIRVQAEKIDIFKRPNSLKLDPCRNPSLSSRISIIDMVNEPVDINIETPEQPLPPPPENLLQSTESSVSEEYNNSLPPTPIVTSSSSSNLSEAANFVRETPKEKTHQMVAIESTGSIISADDTISEISMMQQGLKTMSRTKSCDLLDDLPKEQVRTRPKSLYCGNNTASVASSCLKSASSKQTVDTGCPSSPDESDPMLNEVKKIMKRTELMHKLNDNRWEIEEDYSSCDDVQTDDISVSSSSPAGTPSKDLARGDGFGCSRVGSRLANTSQATSNVVENQPKMRAQKSNHLSVPNRNSLSTTASEPSGTIRLLPQRRVQKGAFRKGDNEEFKNTISPCTNYPNYQSMPRNYGRSSSSANLKGDLESPKYKGSRFSLTSNPEQEEITHLRKVLENYERKIGKLEEKVSSKERQLEQNNTVVAAFEQFQKLRPSSSNSGQIESITDQDNMSSSPVTQLPPTQNGSTNQLNNVRSCGSLTSISSHTSATSGSSSEEQKKKEQRRHWLRDSFRNAFGRGNNAQNNGQLKKYATVHSEKRDSVLDVIDDHEKSVDDSVDSLRSALADSNSRLTEKDSQLTDLRLTALNYQHELETMRNEMRRLREERDNLKHLSRSSKLKCLNGSYSTISGTLNSTKTCSDGGKESDSEKIVVFLEIFEAEKKIIGHINSADVIEDETKLEKSISDVFLTYLKHIDPDCLGLSDASITSTECGDGIATIRISHPAALALTESIKLTKASQLFDAALETRLVLIAGGAAHLKAETAARLAKIIACKELDLSYISSIPDHVIKTTGCLQSLEDFSKVFNPPSDEPEAEQKRPHIIQIDLGLVDTTNLIKTLSGRQGSKTPIVIAIGRDNEITPDCAETFQTFHLSLLGAELGPKLRQKWADHSISTVGQLKMKRTVQSQIKFLEKLQERLNRIIVTYQNANSHLGPAWFLTCPWSSPDTFQTWFSSLWNHKLKPYLQACIIDGIRTYGDRGHEWDDIVHFINNSYPWTQSHDGDDLFQSLTAADCGLIRMDADPLLVMLKRLEAASKLTSDTESDDPYVPYAMY